MQMEQPDSRHFPQLSILLRNHETDNQLFAIIMHWSIAFLVLLNLSIGLYINTFPHNSPRFNGILFYHASIGSLIFMLMAPRLLWRLMHT